MENKKWYQAIIHIECMGVKDFYHDEIQGTSELDAHANAVNNWPDAYRIDIIGASK